MARALSRARARYAGTCPEIDDDGSNACGGSCGVPCKYVEMTEADFALAIQGVPRSALSGCEENTSFTWSEAPYKVFTAWFVAVPLLVVLWCAYNQRLAGASFPPKEVTTQSAQTR